ncbi:Rad4 transglutaminase-like domain-containing protein [Diaporthe helianthi]|uniref:Rad4 transglutaminase-like domain-containing protein n=1 Tax=Diaporthe helianthi TaxID=158607 RepID=A0A2P5I6H0_DIAHE|nr:Rad4 transglutaminase-like domain-containing protein [Diaporthe helianthi]
MPPHVPRKRLREDSPQKKEPKEKGRATAKAIAPPRKPTLFDELDSTISPNSGGKARKQVIELSDDDDSSSLSSLSDADFEDVPGVKRQKTEAAPAEDDEDDDEDIEFENVSYHHPTLAPQAHGPNDGALELTLSHVPTASYADFGGKKGPSKKERQARIATHCMHVEFLMWHNAIRNAWLCDPVTQGIVLSHLPSGMWDEIERFRRACGLVLSEETPKKTATKASKGKTSGKSSGKVGKASEKATRDWGGAAQRLENGAVNLSHGDPLFRLIRSLSAWWRKRFRITAPGLRKMGYMQTRRCANLIKGFNEGGINPSRYGERISSLQWFRLRAQECIGSRDVGAQLFTCLLRALGLEARMVANLQPVGFGFNKTEEAEPEKIVDATEADQDTTMLETSDDKDQPSKKAPKKQAKAAQGKKQAPQSGRPLRKQGRKSLEEDSDESDDDLQLTEEGSEDGAAIEIPPLIATKDSKNKFDRDLEFPNYWTEVLSPATQKYVPVDVMVKNVVGTNRDLVESFSPRGAKADKAKQVMAYVVGFSQDGTAKDVTVRYLKGQVFPGRTKGTRMPLEKIPVYNKHGKVKRYDHFDWFKSVLRAYARGGQKTPMTEVDYHEAATDLKPAQPVKKEVKEGEETLQYFKSSKEFVLERHLKREEALLPTAEPVRYFKNKGKKGDGEEVPVYLRKDVVAVKSEETWHKQGRAPKPGAKPLKLAPFRAATTNRRRELAEAEAAAGHKVLQGLYSHDQTDWIIPPPIKNGIIPKNQYGNIDLFVEHMLPEGAAHVPYRSAIRVCRRLEIDFAEAVVDFEFGHRMAVPVIQGVVIPEEHYDRVMEEVAKEEAEKARKEDEKRRKVVLGAWRKLLMGMRIAERVRREYGHLTDSFHAFGHSRDNKQDAPTGEVEAVDDEDMAGGFLPGGFEHEEEDTEDRGGFHKSSFFPAIEDDEDGGDEGDARLLIEDGGATEEPVAASSPAAAPPQPVKSSGQTRAPRAPQRRTRQRKRVTSSSEENDDEDKDSDGDYEE